MHGHMAMCPYVHKTVQITSLCGNSYIRKYHVLYINIFVVGIENDSSRENIRGSSFS